MPQTGHPFSPRSEPKGEIGATSPEARSERLLVERGQRELHLWYQPRAVAGALGPGRWASWAAGVAGL